MIPLDHIGSAMAGYLPLLLVTLLLELLVVAALAPPALRRRSLLGDAEHLRPHFYGYWLPARARADELGVLHDPVPLR